MKQYAESGVGKPVIGPAFSFSQDILPAVGDAALGVKNTAQWAKDLDNPANKAFVETFQAEYGRLPSLYAAQAYDTANLLLSAIAKADVAMPTPSAPRWPRRISPACAASSALARTSTRSRTITSARWSRKATC